MRSLFICTLVLCLSSPAFAQWHGHGDWHGHGGDHGGGILPGIIGGALLWNLFNPPQPQMPPPEAWAVRPGTPEWNAYCLNKYRSFNPATGTYTGFDGRQYPCQ
jgi:hypothetical protein